MAWLHAHSLLHLVLTTVIGNRCIAALVSSNQCTGFTGSVRKVVYAKGFCWLSTTNLDTWSNHYNNTVGHHSVSNGQLAVFTDADVRMLVWHLFMAPPAGMDAAQLLFVSAKRDYYRSTIFTGAETFDHFHWQARGDNGLRIEIPMGEMEHNLTDSVALIWELEMHYMELWSKNGMLDNYHEAGLFAAIFQYRPPPPVFFTWRKLAGVESAFAVHQTVATASVQSAVLQCQRECGRSMLCYAFTVVPVGRLCRLHYEIARVIDRAVPNADAAVYYVVE